MAGRPTRKAMDTAMVKEAKRPMRGSTPAMMEKTRASLGALIEHVSASLKDLDEAIVSMSFRDVS